MNLCTKLTTMVGAVAMVSAIQVHASDQPTASEQAAQLKSECSEAAEAIEQRQAESSLYERLGGRAGIRALTEEIVRLHLQNEEIRHVFDNVNQNRLITQVTDFMAAGYGGDTEYTGRDMVSAHAHLGISDQEFMSAGGDIGQALANLGHGEKVTQEVICSLMPFHEKIVTQ